MKKLLAGVLLLLLVSACVKPQGQPPTQTPAQTPPVVDISIPELPSSTPSDDSLTGQPIDLGAII